MPHTALLERVIKNQPKTYSLAALAQIVSGDVAQGPEAEEPSRFRPGDRLPPDSEADRLDPLERLGTPERKPAHIREYDLSTAWTLRDLERCGQDGTGRYLLYTRPGQRITTLWAEMLPEVRNLTEQECLLIRLDRVHLYTETVHSLVRALFQRDPKGKRLLPDKRVVFVNPDESTLRALYHTLEIKNDLCLVLEARETAAPETWQLFYVGKLQENLRLAINWLRDSGGATSHEIKQAKELRQGSRGENQASEVTDVQRRLNSLYEIGSVERIPTTSKAGKFAFFYTFFHPAQPFLPPQAQSALTYTVYNPFVVDQARALCEDGSAAIAVNELTQASELGREALQLSVSLGDLPGIARASFLLGDVARSRDALGEAMEYHQRSLELRQRLEDPYELSQSLHNVGLIFAERKDADETALHYYERALAIRLETGDMGEAAKTLNNMGNLYLHMKQFAEMKESGRASLRIRISLGNRRWIASSLFSLAFQAEHTGDWERSVILTAAGQRLLQEIHLPIPAMSQAGVDARLQTAKAVLKERYDPLVEQGNKMLFDAEGSLNYTKAVQYALEGSL